MHGQQNIKTPEKEFLDHLTSENGTDRLFRNVRKSLPIHDA